MDNDIKGKYGLPFFGSLLDLYKLGIWNFYLTYRKQIKAETFVVWWARMPYIWSSNADVAKKISQLSVRGFMFTSDPTPQEYRELNTANDLLWARAKLWQDLRKIMSVPFFPDAMPFYFDQIQGFGNQIIKEIDQYRKKKEAMDPLLVSKLLTTIVILGTAFGVDLDISKSEDRNKLDKINELTHVVMHKDPFEISRALTQIIQLGFYDILNFLRHLGVPVHRMQRIDNSVNLGSYVAELIRQKQNSNKEIDDVIQPNDPHTQQGSQNPLENLKDWRKNIKPGALFNNLQNGLSDGRHLNQKQVLANIGIVMIGGNDTSATNMGTTLFILAQNKHLQNKVLQEIDKFGRNRALTYEDISDNLQENFPYLNSCISETLRLYPPVSSISRQVVSDRFFIGETQIQKGSHAALDIRAMHLQEKYWKDPLRYIPERFMDPQSEYAQKHPNAYAPFGVGARICIGYRLARMEILIGLIKIFQNYEFTVPQEFVDHRIDMFGILSMEPTINLKVIPQLRSNKI